MRFGAAKIDEARKVVYVQEILDATRFVGVWMGQTYECRAIPDTTFLAAGDRPVCHILPGTSEIVAIGGICTEAPIIIWWYGSKETCPIGWLICDDDYDWFDPYEWRPDLSNEFVKCIDWSDPWGYYEDTGGFHSLNTYHAHRMPAHSEFTLDDKSEHTHILGSATSSENTPGAGIGGWTPPEPPAQSSHTHTFTGTQDDTTPTQHTHRFKYYELSSYYPAIEYMPPYKALYGIMSKGSASSIPVGGIVMWSGALGTIPAGFHLCDGAGGTIDLQDQFIIGPSPDIGLNQGDSAPGCDYGAIDLAHTHDFSATQIYDTNHFHDFTSDGLDSGGGAVDSGNAPTAVYDNSGAHTHAMATFADQHIHPNYSGEHNHTGAWDHDDCDEARIDDSIVWQQGEPGPLQLGLPYYYALAFIQRIS